MGTLDDFAADLSQVTADLTSHAITNAQARALVDAAQSGDEEQVRRLAADMSTADLQRVKRHLER